MSGQDARSAATTEPEKITFDRAEVVEIAETLASALHHENIYTEGWQGEVYRWLAKHIDRQARKLRYPSTRRGIRMGLEDVADALVWKAIKRGWK